ncbi:MAG: DNA polymerase IV, partial [Myxococcota bacterium]
LRGRPVLVGDPGARGVVSTASYEARPYGVGSAMPMAQARKRCPDAVIVRPRFDAYMEASRLIREVFDRFSPLVEPLSIDEAFLDMSGTASLLGPPEQIGRDLKEQVRAATQLCVSVGMAPCKYVAKVASDLCKPDGLLVVRPEEVRGFLAPLPVSRLWGVGPKTQPRLTRIGLETLGDVASADPRFLEAELGSLGPHIHRLALGDDPRPVIAEHEAKSIGWERTLEQDVRGEEAILPHLRRAADEVARRLRAEGLEARGLRIKLKTRDFVLHTRQCRLPQTTDSAPYLYEAAGRLLGEAMPALPVRLIGMAAFDLDDGSAPRQQSLFTDEKRGRRSRLDQALDAIDERFGRGAVQRASELGDRTDEDEGSE